MEVKKREERTGEDEEYTVEYKGRQRRIGIGIGLEGRLSMGSFGIGGEG